MKKKVFIISLILFMIQKTYAVTELSIEDVLNKIKNYETGFVSGSYYSLDSIVINDSSKICTGKYIYEFLVKNSVAELTERYSSFDAVNHRYLNSTELTKYSCNTLNRTVTKIVQSWEKNKWVNNHKNDYTYDKDYHIIFKSNSYWEKLSNLWIPSYKTEYAFNENGEKTLEACYAWDRNLKKWVGDEEDGKMEIFYNPTGCIYIDSEWDDEQNIWEYSRKTETIESESGDSTLFYHYYWDSSNNTWIFISKSKREETIVGNVESDTYYNWDTLNNVWLNDYKSEIIIDNIEVGRREMHNSYNWSMTSGDWEQSYKYETFIDNNNNQISNVDYYLNKETQEWKKDSRNDYTYDVNSHKTSETHSIYHTSQDLKDSISISRKYVWIYDDHGNLSQYKSYSEHSKSEYVNNVYTTFYYFGLDYTDSYFYKRITLSSLNDAIQSRNYAVYPNPVSGDFFIKDISDGELVQFYDLNGRFISSTRIRGNNPIPAESLQSGMYILKISSVEGPIVLKMEKK